MDLLSELMIDAQGASHRFHAAGTRAGCHRRGRESSKLASSCPVDWADEIFCSYDLVQVCHFAVKSVYQHRSKRSKYLAESLRRA